MTRGEIDLREGRPRLTKEALALHACALRHIVKVSRMSPHLMFDEIVQQMNELGGIDTIVELCDAGWWKPDDNIPGCYEITQLGLLSGVEPT